MGLDEFEMVGIRGGKISSLVTFSTLRRQGKHNVTPVTALKHSFGEGRSIICRLFSFRSRVLEP